MYLKRIIIDIGSGNIKAYEVDRTNIKNIYLKNIEFKKHFSKDIGISEEDINLLIEAIKYIQLNNPELPIWAGATSIFRMLTNEQRNRVEERIFNETGIGIHVISKEQEAIYMAKAVGDIPEINEPYLVCCVGGSSTEMIVMQNDSIIEHKTEEFATGDMLKQFPEIANDITNVDIDKMLNFVSQKFTNLPKKKCRFAIFTGFHLMYNQVAQNTMHNNNFFENSNIPFYLTVDEFDTNNEYACSHLNLQTLKQRYPQNPNFMNGTRGCHTVVSYIMHHVGAEFYFPTNLNMINGIVNELNKDELYVKNI